MKDDKFEFVNDVDSDIIDPSDMIEKKIDYDPEEPKFEFVPEEERSERIKLVRVALIMIMVSVSAFVLALIWSNDTSLLGICDALWLVTVVQFFAGWMMLMNNMNILSPFVYGAKSFGKLIVGKRMSTDYYTYMQLKEENPIPKYYYRICFICSLVTGIPAIILLFIV